MLPLSRSIAPRLLIHKSSLLHVQKASRVKSLLGVPLYGPDPNLEVGDWPRTKEEREKAARKYNLIPEDYEPHDEDDGFGDYPKLKAIGAFNRDQYDDYDDYMGRRFYGEVFHKDADLYSWEKINPLKHEIPDYSWWTKSAIFFLSPLVIPVTYWIFKEYKIQINHPHKKRLYHDKDQKYYEFPSPS